MIARFQKQNQTRLLSIDADRIAARAQSQMDKPLDYDGDKSTMDQIRDLKFQIIEIRRVIERVEAIVSQKADLEQVKQLEANVDAAVKRVEREAKLLRMKQETNGNIKD